MDFDEIVVKGSPGLCRCCLSEGCYKDLSSEYAWMNDTEIYADMLLECFDISISQHVEGPNGSSRLICEVCITRLRDACNFKKQVLDSEKKFVDMVGRGEFRSKVVVFQAQMKTEPAAQEAAEESVAEVEYLEDIDYGDDDDTLKDEPTVSDIMVSQLPEVTVKRTRGKKTTIVKPKKAKEEKPKTSKAAVKDETSSSTAMIKRKSLVTLFNNTTIIPFKWRSRYGCFYCSERSLNYRDFVKHAKSHSPYTIHHESLRRQKTKHTEVKLDVSKIQCELCDEPFEKFNDIVDHLVTKHGLFYDKTVEMNLPMYRLSDLKCLHCNKKFQFFRNLVSHVNNLHPTDCYPCSVCGKVFNKKADFTVHFRSYHKEGGYKCVICRISFRNASALRIHKTTHGDLKLDAETLRSLKVKDEWATKEDEVVLAGIQVRRSEMIERNAIAKKNRQNVACILNMTTAIPFKYHKNKFTCFYCNKDFLEHEDMREHTVMEHPFYDLEQKCPKSLKGVNIVVKLDITSLSCKICYEVFNDLDMIIDHLISAHDAKYDKSISGVMYPYRLEKYNMICPVCQESFTYFSHLLRHMNKEHLDRVNLCALCGEAFVTKQLLSIHQKRAHGPKDFKCEVCNIYVGSLVKLKTHQAKVHGVKDVVCTKCMEKFPSQYEKLKHQLRVHNIGHKCTYCDRMFIRNSFMRNHVRRTHIKEKNVECTVCFEKFFDNFMLKSHMVKHIGEKDFHCDVCGKSFFWKKNLRVHVASHYKYKPANL